MKRKDGLDGIEKSKIRSTAWREPERVQGVSHIQVKSLKLEGELGVKPVGASKVERG